MGSTYNMLDMLNKRMINVPGQIEQNSIRFYHVTQISTKYKNNEVFISEIIHLIILNYSWLWTTKTVRIKTMDKGRLM